MKNVEGVQTDRGHRSEKQSDKENNSKMESQTLKKRYKQKCGAAVAQGADCSITRGLAV